MFSKISYDQIYDEHVFIFSLRSIQNICEKYNLEVFDIKNDPNEFNNIVNSQLFKNDREQMYIRAQKRLNKILD